MKFPHFQTKFKINPCKVNTDFVWQRIDTECEDYVYRTMELNLKFLFCIIKDNCQ